MIHLIHQVGRTDKRLITQHVRAPWLQIFDGVTALRPVFNSDQAPMLTSEKYLMIWNGFGTLLGLKGDELQCARALERSGAMGGVTGCSWIRCPLFGAVEMTTQREIMRCSQCQKVRSPGDQLVCSDPHSGPLGPVLWSSLPTNVRPIRPDFRVKS